MTNRNISRRGMLAAGAAVGIGASVAHAGNADDPHRLTPTQTEGPFYPTKMQADRDADLTQVEGQDDAAIGKVVVIEGQITDENGEPIAGAVVDIWQANAAGRYAHELEKNPAPLDPNFQGWAIIAADEKGRYRFKTIEPGAYPARESWMRPPHIHFKVSRRGFHELTTQMYFPNHPLNDVDHLFLQTPLNERNRMVAQESGQAGSLVYNVVLAKV